ncbi:MAG: PEP-CTERM sorting domain-containing protein [Candidatus Brocadiia bacterium]
MSKKLGFAVVLVGVASLAAAGPLSIPVSFPYRVQMSMDDGTSLYDMATGDPILHDYDLFQHSPDELATLLVAGPSGQGMELRGIWYCDDISMTNPGSTKVYDSPETDGFEITGVVHGLQVSYARVTDTTIVPGVTPTRYQVYLEYAPTADQTLGSTIFDEAHPAGQAAINGGGRATFYTDVSPDSLFDPDGNQKPDDWVSGAFAQGPEGRLDYPTFSSIDINNLSEYAGGGSPTAGDVEVLLDTAFVRLQDMGYGTVDPNAVLTAVIELEQGLGGSPGSSTFGSSSAYLNSIRDLFGADPANAVDLTTVSGFGNVMDNEMSIRRLAGALGGDAYILSNLQWGFARTGKVVEPESGWLFASHDPVEFVTVPEPATCVLLGGSLIALVRRRKRK